MADINISEFTIGNNTYKYTDSTFQAELDDKVDKVEGYSLISNDDLTKLAGIPSNANHTDVDNALSSSSENPVQNKVIKEAIDELKEYATTTTEGMVKVGDSLQIDDGFLDIKNKVTLSEVRPAGLTDLTIATITDNDGNSYDLTVPTSSNVSITPATITGTKVKIADFVIDGAGGELWAPAGGGGGSGQSVIVPLYENGSSAGDITLDDDYDKYDLLYFTVIKQAGGETTKVITSIETSKISLGDFIQVMGGSAGADWLIYEINSKTVLELDSTPSSVFIESIVGIKIGSTDVDAMHKGVDYVTAGQLSGSTLGTNATAEGKDVTAYGNYSHAEGYHTYAYEDYAHAEGYLTTANGKGSHVEGGYTTAVFGGGTYASGNNAHAEGYDTHADGEGAHAEGYKTYAYGDYSHAEGGGPGGGTSATGNYSHAEGYVTNASGNYSHASGHDTCASGDGSFTAGYQTQASYDYQTAIGKYNAVNSDYAFMVGNGTSSRSNAFTVEWDGDLPDTTIEKLSNVQTSSPVDGQVLKYSNGVWVNANESGAITDVKVDNISVVTSGIANINTMTGAGASAAGTKGLVPAPSAGDEDKFLAGDGTWKTGGGGGGTSDYTDLTNKPQINGITLSGNKTSSDLGMVITLTQAQYDALPTVEKEDSSKVYYISDATTTATTVVPNPVGTPTEVLSSIQIGETIYSFQPMGQTVVESLSNDITKMDRVYNENISIEQV